MRTSFKFTMIPLFLLLILAGCEKDKGFGPMEKGPKLNKSFALPVYVQDDCGGTLTTDLVAGKSTVVGQVVVMKNGSNELKVTYSIPAGSDWYLKEVHLEVQPSLEDFPLGGGSNPKIGNFSYVMSFDPMVKEYTFDNVWVGTQSHVLVMAHAVVAGVYGFETDLAGLDLSLPETVQYYVTRTGDSYFTTTVKTPGILQGFYEGWCIDTDHTINTGETNIYTAEVISSLTEGFDMLGLVEDPGNMPLVNFVLNQDYVGRVAADGQVFTYGDVQRAIWALVEDTQSTSGLGTWSQAHVDQILAEAADDGEGFVPDCGDVIAVVLKPVGVDAQITIAQITLVEFPVVCEPLYFKETAWAAGDEIGGNSWAMVVPYCLFE